jgi:hypothetical protein
VAQLSANRIARQRVCAEREMSAVMLDRAERHDTVVAAE